MACSKSQRPLLHQITQTPWGSHHYQSEGDLSSVRFGESRLLLMHRGAAVHCDGVDPGRPSVPHALGVYLQRKFARGGEHQSGRRRDRRGSPHRCALCRLPLGHGMEDGQQEGKCLAAARLCHRDDIFAAACYGPGMLLDWRWCLESRGGYYGHDGCGERRVAKVAPARQRHRRRRRRRGFNGCFRGGADDGRRVALVSSSCCLIRLGRVCARGCLYRLLRRLLCCLFRRLVAVRSVHGERAVGLVALLLLLFLVLAHLELHRVPGERPTDVEVQERRSMP
mmetsp:Transcript_440/g.1099  ORF Transcript_440/g.1099 Transcript_440/m.1099 type:complete len:281 (+) Transcript_440:231-1073(+)